MSEIILLGSLGPFNVFFGSYNTSSCGYVNGNDWDKVTGAVAATEATSARALCCLELSMDLI